MGQRLVDPAVGRRLRALDVPGQQQVQLVSGATTATRMHLRSGGAGQGRQGELSQEQAGGWRGCNELGYMPELSATECGR